MHVSVRLLFGFLFFFLAPTSMSPERPRKLSICVSGAALGSRRCRHLLIAMSCFAFVATSISPGLIGVPAASLLQFTGPCVIEEVLSSLLLVFDYAHAQNVCALRVATGAASLQIVKSACNGV